MAFLTGMILVDAPASALNNAGGDDTARTQNAVATKFISTKQGRFPYVSGQAFRYWLRTTCAQEPALGWKAAPVFREQKVAYTDANPIEWWDDDLFGYMRAPSKRADAVERRRSDANRANETPTTTEITRVSPFRVSTLVSLAPVSPTQDFGTMSRHDGDPVPHEHQFYRTVLKGLFSLDLHAVGTFSYRDRTGYRNLDETRQSLCEELKLEHLESEQSYRLPDHERIRRVRALVQGLAILGGGAKQALHYTDVTPVVLLAMVTRGGNNPLQYAVGPDAYGLPRVNPEALAEVARVWGDQILSPLYVGWVQGFHDAERARLDTCLATPPPAGAGSLRPQGYQTAHPREALGRLAEELGRNAESWLG
jgi:CRISPR-associated protein Cst2